MSRNESSELVTSIDDELDLLAELVALEGGNLLELGCGNAKLARELLKRHPGCSLVGLEVDEQQHAKNLGSPQRGLSFHMAGAQAIPFEDSSFDGTLMLKSFHHVPTPLMHQALEEVARVLRPGGWFYVSEPVFAGELNELTRIYNDERVVRAAAQAALDEACRAGRWKTVAERRFETPARFRDFAEFEQVAMRPTFADHRIDDAIIAAVKERFERHARPEGAEFRRPMLARLMTKIV